jgi:alginate O-acetyltransferase complex protein AlgI
MNLTQILVFSAFALLTGWLSPPRWHRRILLLGSLMSLFWLQPSTPIRNLDFWLPVASIALTGLVWAVTRSKITEERWVTLVGAFFILGAIIAVGLTRYSDWLCCLTASRPPDILHILFGVSLAGSLIVVAYIISGWRFFPSLTILVILALFVALKTEALSQALSAGLRSLTGQPSNLASPSDLLWLGFSYLAFRLLHVLRDHQAGKLPALALDEFVIYALFFPAITAGPIDRAPRFVADLRLQSNTVQPVLRSHPADLSAGVQRIVWGTFKKFVLADSLALVALNAQNAPQITSTAWAWLLLYAYTLRIYLDFSGYTDIAIGLARLLGIHLPENFDRPYLKTNLTAFWNSWHITLAQWFRAYFFNPVTRSLRKLSRKMPAWEIILLGQAGTMVLIGMWHGLTWNFVVWGAWHALGLFIHNRWSDWLRPRLAERSLDPRISRLLQAGGGVLTFHYVALGWVWFALPDLATSWSVLLKLAGF